MARHWWEPRGEARFKAAVVLLGLLVSLAVGAVAFRLGLLSRRGRQPCCRKSSSMVVLFRATAGGGARTLPPAPESTDPSLRGQAGEGQEETHGSEQHMDLVVWSGIGKHKAIFDDLHRFDLASRTWRRIHPGPGPAPVSRWKSGSAQAVRNGMVVVGGDAYTPGTFHHEYLMDVWWLDYGSLRWHEAFVDPAGPRPQPRRGHSLVHYKGQDGIDRIILFGGRTREKVVLNDAWEVALLWSATAGTAGSARLTATWRQLTPLQPGSDHAPEARRGHAALLLPDTDQPNMLMYGGRQELLYFNDLWVLDVAGHSWSRVDPAGEVAPRFGRDHHSVALFRGDMVVFGGHTGPDYCHAFPANDVWAFSLGNRTWREVHPSGPRPLPRFEHSHVQYTPQGSTEASRLLVFGGQTDHGCQLNDVWELCLDEWRWQLLSTPRFCTRECRKRYGGQYGGG